VRKELMFYTFRQNNSGGSWNGPIAVCIEAGSLDEAGTKAESVGLYFDGSEDCPCCGSRWSTSPEEGSEPLIYGEPLREFDGGICGSGQIPWKIYFADGRVEEGTRV